MKCGGRRIAANVRDKGAGKETIVSECKAIGRVITRGEVVVKESGEGSDVEVEVGGSRKICVSGKGLVFLGAVEVAHIGGQVSKGKIVHAFVKAHMGGEFDTVGLDIIP